MGRVRITQIRSTIDKERRQKATMVALGLKKMNQSVEHELTPQIQGMISKVSHLISVETL